MNDALKKIALRFKAQGSPTEEAILQAFDLLDAVGAPPAKAKRTRQNTGDKAAVARALAENRHTWDVIDKRLNIGKRRVLAALSGLLKDKLVTVSDGKGCAEGMGWYKLTDAGEVYAAEAVRRPSAKSIRVPEQPEQREIDFEQQAQGMGR